MPAARGSARCGAQGRRSRTRTGSRTSSPSAPTASTSLAGPNAFAALDGARIQGRRPGHEGLQDPRHRARRTRTAATSRPTIPRLDAFWEMAAKYKSAGHDPHERLDRTLLSDRPAQRALRSGPVARARRHVRKSLQDRAADAGGDREGAGEHAPEAPEHIFVNAHMAMLYYDPAKLAKLLDTYPECQVEVSATVQDLGRAPRLWREFIIKYQDRVLFGTDGGGTSDPDTFWNPALPVSSKPMTSTSSIPRRSACRAARPATAAGTSRESPCLRRSSARCTTRMR